MKNLETYIAAGNTLSALADGLGVTKARMSQLRKAADWPPDIALRAEQVTKYKLDAGELSSIVKQARLTAPAR